MMGEAVAGLVAAQEGLWVKVIQMLEQNWAAVELADSERVGSTAEAIAGLTRTVRNFVCGRP